MTWLKIVHFGVIWCYALLVVHARKKDPVYRAALVYHCSCCYDYLAILYLTRWRPLLPYGYS